VRAYLLLEDCYSGLWFDRAKTPAWGLAGGGDGKPVRHAPQPQERGRTRRQSAHCRQQPPPQAAWPERQQGVSRTHQQRDTNQKGVENAVHSGLIRDRSPAAEQRR
jgi:hypothetical protein